MTMAGGPVAQPCLCKAPARPLDELVAIHPRIEIPNGESDDPVTDGPPADPTT